MLYYVGTDSVALYVVLNRYRFYGPVRYFHRYGFFNPICYMQPAGRHVTFNSA
jgi:hypothetical protein